MLYTRKGDSGTTKSFSSKGRLSKTDPLFEALGTVDELNALLGVCKMKAEGSLIARHLETIQQHLFILQAELAGAGKQLTAEHVLWLEHETDAIESTLPPITTFFLAGGTELSAQLDLARTVARRAERRVLAAHEGGVELADASLAYVNRLSSLLYAFARKANSSAGASEQPPTY